MFVRLRRFLKVAGVVSALSLLSINTFASEPVVRVGVLKFGTVNWELKSMKHHGLDKANGFSLEIVPFAGGDATRIALMGGEVDIIVSDWLWVSRQRSDGRDFTFSPYSSSVGAIMVPGGSDLKNLGELRGKKIGVAGGPLDKSWLLLQGMAKQDFDMDLAGENEIVFGAPPLLAEKARDGELDAVLNYWHFCARLESVGFARLVSAEVQPTRWDPPGLYQPLAMFLMKHGLKTAWQRLLLMPQTRPKRLWVLPMRNGPACLKVVPSKIILQLCKSFGTDSEKAFQQGLLKMKSQMQLSYMDCSVT